MSKKAKKNIWFNSWWDKINPTWQAIISIGIVFSAGFGAGDIFEKKNHSMEIIEQKQLHNLDLQSQHDEFEDKLSVIKEQLDECKQQYRNLEIEKGKDGHEK